MAELPPEIQVTETPDSVTYRLPRGRFVWAIDFWIIGFIVLLIAFYGGLGAYLHAPGRSLLSGISMVFLLGIFVPVVRQRIEIRLDHEGVRTWWRPLGLRFSLVKRKGPVQQLEVTCWNVRGGPCPPVGGLILHLRHKRMIALAFRQPLPLLEALAADMARRAPEVIDPLCPQCKYLLRELTRPVCPECGLDLQAAGMFHDGRPRWPAVPVVANGFLSRLAAEAAPPVLPAENPPRITSLPDGDGWEALLPLTRPRGGRLAALAMVLLPAAGLTAAVWQAILEHNRPPVDQLFQSPIVNVGLLVLLVLLPAAFLGVMLLHVSRGLVQHTTLRVTREELCVISGRPQVRRRWRRKQILAVGKMERWRQPAFPRQRLGLMLTGGPVVDLLLGQREQDIAYLAQRIRQTMDLPAWPDWQGLPLK